MAFVWGLPALLCGMAVATGVPADPNADSLTGVCSRGECSKEQVLLQHAMSARVTAVSQISSESEVLGETCYGEFHEVVADEGNDIGVPEITGAQSDLHCKSVCSGNDRCNSFTHCPQWGTCFLKDRRLSGIESTNAEQPCKTYYKKACSSTAIKVASYNLFWWNAFRQNSWKSNHVIANIQSFNADTLGLQECDEPQQIADRSGYSAASKFDGAQGVVVKPGVVKVEQSGSRDIGATGKWGPRYVTWAELTHIASGRRFWHFNTHWCVHSGNGRTCDSGTRHVGAKNMLNIIREKAGTDSPVVITGDFNAEMWEPGPNHFLQNGFSLAVNHWVDSIFFTTAHWNVKSTAIGETAYSDHKPVIAMLELK